jgi:peptidoglycan/xylan/chitin deacetylase (PgdA/CDA1 family)
MDSVRRMTVRLLAPFQEQKIPLIGFVNAGQSESLGAPCVREMLDLWLAAGAELGNHTYSHPSIDTSTFEEYTADIVEGEPLVRAALEARGKKLEFFRHPFLHTGEKPEVKKKLQEFLDRRGYRVAPVTIDNDDYLFASVYQRPEFQARVKREYVPYMESVVAFFEQRSKEVVGREIPQVLLIHASQMNADVMPDLLAMFRRRGYEFISLEKALADPAYSLRDDFVGRKGISWLHRWAVAKGMKAKEEPESPQWVRDAWATRRRG